MSAGVLVVVECFKMKSKRALSSIVGECYVIGVRQDRNCLKVRVNSSASGSTGG